MVYAQLDSHLITVQVAPTGANAACKAGLSVKGAPLFTLSPSISGMIITTLPDDKKSTTHCQDTGSICACAAQHVSSIISMRKDALQQLCIGSQST